MVKAAEAEAKKEKGNVQYTSEKRRLFHEFTESDINIVNAKVTELTKKKEEFAEEAKLQASIAKGAECEIKKALQSLDEGGEEREMDCLVVIDFSAGTYTVKHPETGEVIEERGLTPDERQQSLFDDDEGAEEKLDSESDDGE